MIREKETIKEAFDNWESKSVNKVLSKYSERKNDFVLDTENTVKRLYTPLDIETEYNSDLGYPGEFPFTRGVQPTMYRGKLWTMRMYAGFATAEESNKRYKYLIKQGSKGLSVAFDLPTQLGYDSDDEMCMGEVGKVGVAIDSIEDMEILFNDINLEKVSTSMTINAPSAVLLAMYIVVAKKQGADISKLRGTIQNDILKEYVARGTYIFPIQESMRLTTDIFSYCSSNLPNWNTISISGYHIREAGANAIEEIAFTLANGIAYVNAAINAGLDVDDFAPRLSFFFASHNNLLEEVAKFRAARRLWAKIMREKFNAKKDKSCMLKFHTQTAGSTLTAQQPDNNIMRVTIQALAAILGGTQSLHTNSRDEALSLPTEDSVTIALRTQQIIGEESGVCDTIDPLAGSYYVESLTNQIEEEAMSIIEKVENMGGSPKAIENGYIQETIMTSAYKYQQKIESNEKIIIGVNKYKTKEEEIKDLLKVDESVELHKKEKLKLFRQRRDKEKMAKSLESLRKACNSTENLMDYIIDAVESYATLGEICKVMREEFGEYIQGDVF